MSRFDRYMVHVDIGTDEKLADLTASERLCHVVGVLAVAAKSPIRGCLIVGDAEATATQVARRAAVPDRVAKSTLRKLISVGVLIRDEEIGAWRVHNWERFNPEPKSDPTNAQRQARWRERNANRNAQVTPVTELHNVGSPRAGAIARARSPEGNEEEGEIKTPLTPQGGISGKAIPLVAPLKPKGNRKTDLDAFAVAMRAWSFEHFPGCDPKDVGRVVSHIRGLGGEPTPDAMREYVKGRPLWEPFLRPIVREAVA